ncbi:hypothetical protein [Paraburkholderia xenovorans]|uniref:hypothetical protein n=1 Tax=Paraburkholderia xenovorans TaxID=36873 RepID=UPI000319E99F|nr:hypothetical protein [Paraburkholderia xenovorans]
MPTNLAPTWKRVNANLGSADIDGRSISKVEDRVQKLSPVDVLVHFCGFDLQELAAI